MRLVRIWSKNKGKSLFWSILVNFRGCEGVSANYFDILKASIDLKFFCEQGYGCVGWPKIALEWFQGVILHFRNFWIFLLHYFADLLLNFLVSENLYARILSEVFPSCMYNYTKSKSRLYLGISQWMLNKHNLYTSFGND